MALSRSGERGTWVVRLWLLERRGPPSSTKMLMSKISHKTPNVIVWYDWSCIVALRRVTHKREAPRSDGDTRGVSAKGTLMLKPVTFSANSGDPIGLNSECSRYSNKWLVRCQVADCDCCIRTRLSDPTGRCDTDSEGPAEQVVLINRLGSSAQINGAGLDHSMTV
ncbi:hypothetical protein TIFTF001_038339 [Ficus carica]|uniref:Uncharacterized protein n=1 Tax=Ficus carica TaxID=3494 RepID=A0AA88EID9_FICCA|nr:hypothetical protein TIFTF001_038339 [Ficus carica]